VRAREVGAKPRGQNPPLTKSILAEKRLRGMVAAISALSAASPIVASLRRACSARPVGSPRINGTYPKVRASIGAITTTPFWAASKFDFKRLNIETNAPCILVVEDDRLNRFVLKEALEEAGFRAILASRAEEAILFLQQCGRI
jgi:PleD family two-component response regulator